MYLIQYQPRSQIFKFPLDNQNFAKDNSESVSMCHSDVFTPTNTLYYFAPTLILLQL